MKVVVNFPRPVVQLLADEPYGEVHKQKNKTNEVTEMKANEAKKNETKKPVETVKPVQQVQHRQKRNFYLYNEVEGKFLMNDRTFSTSGQLYVFNSLAEAKAVGAFFANTIVLTKAVQ